MSLEIRVLPHVLKFGKSFYSKFLNAGSKMLAWTKLV